MAPGWCMGVSGFAGGLGILGVLVCSSQSLPILCCFALVLFLPPAPRLLRLCCSACAAALVLLRLDCYACRWFPELVLPRGCCFACGACFACVASRDVLYLWCRACMVSCRACMVSCRSWCGVALNLTALRLACGNCRALVCCCDVATSSYPFCRRPLFCSIVYHTVRGNIQRSGYNPRQAGGHLQ